MIYFIKYGEDRVKIGYTKKSIERRLFQLNNEAPNIDKAILLTMDGDKKKEKGLHDMFRDICVGNEYFEYSDKIKRYIRSKETGGKYKYNIEKVCGVCGSDDIYYVMSTDSIHGYKIWCKTCGMFNGFLRKVLNEYVPDDKIEEEKLEK